MRFGISLSLTQQLGGFSPASLFSSGQQGAWYDPSDRSTLFQDSAGTTPVTTPGQTVARVNDKSGRDNHATQATAASRPTYGVVPATGRRNIIINSEALDDASWTKSGGVTVTPNAAVAPDGAVTADRVTSPAGGLLIAPTFQLLTATPVTFSIWMRSAVPGTPQTVPMSIAGAGAANQTVGDAWQRFSVTWAGATAGSWNGRVGPGAFDVFAWGGQVELASAPTAYQRVGSAFDVTEAGVQSLSYLFFDGIDDFLVTPTITPGIDKAQVFAGVRKLSDAAAGIVAELGNNNSGGFYVAAPVGASSTYAFRAPNTSILASASGFAAPTTNVLTGLNDVNADNLRLRVNGIQVAQNTTDQGTGNYLAYPLYIGRRGGSVLPFNGNLYSLIVRFGANLDANTISNTETWVNSKTGAY